MSCLGFDTSNYTTSAAWYNGVDGVNYSQLLPVREGQLGLRQSDALFFHMKQLPSILQQLMDTFAGSVTAVAASTQPRAVAGSYMPCFLAGASQAEALAAAFRVPCYAFSHQQGHVAAVLWSAQRLDLLNQRFLAWHLSGGTTELLLIEPGSNGPVARRIGGTTDLAAGQLIDRTGKLLGLGFPAGKQLDALAGEVSSTPYHVRLRDLEFSLSGMENQVKNRQCAGEPPEIIASFCLSTIAETVFSTTVKAMRIYPGLPVVFSGGVASNRYLRVRCQESGAVFADAMYSTDNAMGIAVLGMLQQKGGIG